MAYADGFLPEDEVLASARARADDIGTTPVTPATGALLRLLAASVNARTVVEVGTGTGVSGTWLLRGMVADGVLTSIDVEAEHQRLARRTFTEGGWPASHVRLITGRAQDVLRRLADGAYDLVLFDAEPVDYAGCLPEALRLLRPGGLLVVDDALGAVADPGSRDQDTLALRELGSLVREEDALVPALVPVGAGLLLAVKASRQAAPGEA